VYPDHTLCILMRGNNGLTVDDSDFKTYYNEVKNNLLKHVDVIGLIGYYDYPWESRMISDDRKELLLYASLIQDISNEKLKKIVSITPLTVLVGGSIAQGKEFNDFILAGVETAEFGSLPVLFILLILSLGGFMASLMPWYTAIFGIMWSLTLLLAFNLSFRISGVSANIVTMFGLGLAIDYTLFIVSRFTTERKRYPHVRVQLILKRTAQTSGKTVAISAATVFIALSGGLLFEEFFLASICLAVMLASLTSAIFANFFLYAQLMILDDAILRCPTPTIENVFKKIGVWKSGTSKVNAVEYHPATQECELPAADTSGAIIVRDVHEFNSTIGESKGTTTADLEAGDTKACNSIIVSKVSISEDDVNEQSFWYQCGKVVLKNPLLSFLSSSSILIAFTIVFFLKVKFGQTDADVLPPTSEVRYVYDRTQSNFRLNGQASIFVALQTKSDTLVTSSQFLDALNHFQSEVYSQAKLDGVKLSNTYSMINIGLTNYSLADYKAMYATPLAPQYSNVTSALIFPLGLTDLNHWTYVFFALPYYQYSFESKHAVRIVRRMLKQNSVFRGANNQPMLAYSGVAGAPAEVLDLYKSLGRGLPAWSIIMMGAVFTILVLMTESLLLPLKAVVVSILSLGATFGILLLVFTSTDPSVDKSLGIDPTGYMDGSNIIFIFSVAFGLSVDYEVFLLSRVLEEFKKIKDVDRAVLRAMDATGGLITSAAVGLLLYHINTYFSC